MKLDIVRSVLLGVSTLVIASGAAAKPQGATIVDTVIAANASGPYAGSFDTLIAALQAADPAVLHALGGNGQFTVFGPTDDAFAALNLNPGNVGSAFPQSTLTEILQYHVARGRRGATDVTSASQIRTLQGGFIQISGTTLTDAVNRTSNIVVPDVAASNGVIHVIDAVVLPYQP